MLKLPIMATRRRKAEIRVAPRESNSITLYLLEKKRECRVVACAERPCHNCAMKITKRKEDQDAKRLERSVAKDKMEAERGWQALVNYEYRKQQVQELVNVIGQLKWDWDDMETKRKDKGVKEEESVQEKDKEKQNVKEEETIEIQNPEPMVKSEF